MPRIVDVHLNDHGVLVDGTDQFDGEHRDAIRQALEAERLKTAGTDTDTVVHVHRRDGGIKTMTILRDGTFLQRPPVDPKAAERRVPVRPETGHAWWKLQSRGKIIGAAVAGVVVLGTVVALTTGTSTDPTTGGGEFTAFSRTAPTGWSQQVVWDYSPVGESAPLPTGNRLVTVSPEGNISAVNADTGAIAWSTEPLIGAQAATPVVGGSGDEGFVAVKSGSTISVLPLRSTGTHVEPKTVDASPTATLTSQGTGVLVTEEGKPSAVLSADAVLRPLTVPAGQAVYEVLDDGAVVIAPAAGPWSLLPEAGTTSVITPAAPTGSIGVPHTVSSVRGVVVAWWDTPDPQNRIVAFHDARTGSVTASTAVAAAVVDGGLPTVVSEDRSLLSAGPVVANTSTRETTVHDGWMPSNATSRAIFGKVGSKKAMWSGSGTPALLPEGAAVPWAITDAGLAIVLDELGNSTRIAALRKADS